MMGTQWSHSRIGAWQLVDELGTCEPLLQLGCGTVFGSSSTHTLRARDGLEQYGAAHSHRGP